MVTEFKLSYTGSEINNKLGKIDGLVESEERLTNEIAVERARINTLTSLGEGSTTGDAELQDIRTGYDGTIYETAGEAVRSQIRQVNTKHDAFFDDFEAFADFDRLTPALTKGYRLSPQGTIEANASSYITENIPAEEGNVFLISTTYEPWYTAASFFDASGNVLAKLRDGNTLYTKAEFVAPANTSYLVVTAKAEGDIAVWKKQSQAVYMSSLQKKLSDAYIKSLPIAFDEYEAEDVTGSLQNGFLQPKGYTTGGSQDAYKVSDLIEVAPFEIYEVQGSCNYSNYAYAFFDGKGAYVSTGKQGDGTSTNQTVREIVVAPYTAKYLAVAQYGHTAYIKKITAVKGGKMWTGKRWMALGDSLTEQNGRALTNYHTWIAQQTGITNVNCGESGAGYGNLNGLNNRFIDLFTQHENENFDVITIFGSGNDMSSGMAIGTKDDTYESNTLGGWVNKTLDYIYSKMPFVPVGIITPTPWYNYPPTEEGNKMEQYSNLLVEIAKKRGIPCLDLYHESNLHPEFENFREVFYKEGVLSDGGIHPNSKGHKERIAPQVREFLKKLIY